MPVEDRQENDTDSRRLWDMIKVWSDVKRGEWLIPKDLPWDRVTSGATRYVSYYKGNMLLSMFLGLSNKALTRQDFCGITPVAHNKNAAWKLVRMAYQISIDPNLSYKSNFVSMAERLSRLMTAEGIRVEDYV